MEDGPKPFKDAIDEVLLRLIPQQAGEDYGQLKRELKYALEDVRKHFKSAVHFLKRRRGKPAEFVELEAKYRQDVERIQVVY